MNFKRTWWFPDPRDAGLEMHIEGLISNYITTRVLLYLVTLKLISDLEILPPWDRSGSMKSSLLLSSRSLPASQIWFHAVAIEPARSVHCWTWWTWLGDGFWICWLVICRFDCWFLPLPLFILQPIEEVYCICGACCWVFIRCWTLLRETTIQPPRLHPQIDAHALDWWLMWKKHWNEEDQPAGDPRRSGHHFIQYTNTHTEQNVPQPPAERGATWLNLTHKS